MTAQFWLIFTALPETSSRATSITLVRLPGGTAYVTIHISAITQTTIDTPYLSEYTPRKLQLFRTDGVRFPPTEAKMYEAAHIPKRCNLGFERGSVRVIRSNKHQAMICPCYVISRPATLLTRLRQSTAN